MSPDGAIGHLEFPEEWMTSEFMFAEIVASYRRESDGLLSHVAGGVLEDGSNLIGLTHPAGQRVARSSPSTGWALEERFSGDQNAMERDVGAIWRQVVAAVVAAGGEVDRMFGGGPRPARPPERVVLDPVQRLRKGRVRRD